MKNNFKQIILGSFVALSVLSSCENDLTGLNVDPKHPETIPSVNLLTTSQKYMADLWVSPGVNVNVSRFFTQQWTEVQYVTETNYDFPSRQQNRFHYRTIMREYLGPLAKAKLLLAEEQEDAGSGGDLAQIKANKLATLEILSIFGWANLVDTFGDVPYSEALTGINTENGVILQPKYDDAATIYADLVTRLDAAVATINTSSAGYDDLVYHGDMTKWVKFANTLKLQMGLNLSDVNSATAKTLVEEAVADGVIVDAADNYEFPYEDAQYSNPIYQNLVASGRNDFLPSDVYLDYMQDNNDPRVFSYFSENLNVDLGVVEEIVVDVNTPGLRTINFESSVTGSPVIGDAIFINDQTDDEERTYIGKVTAVGTNFIVIATNSNSSSLSVGDELSKENYIPGVYGELNTYANFSHLSSIITQPDYPGYVFDDLYTKFMLAEAAARGYSVGGTAATLYADAVQTSMDLWGVPSTDSAAFLAAHPYDAANWKTSIGYAAWIGLYNRGFEAWYFFRRLDAPTLTVPPIADSLVYRMPYSLEEYSQNETNVTAAASAIGGDTYGNKVFWDVN